ncbi:ESX secretion-associated protein EspG [Nocardia carnea]|uniref:ESX secretion-associated protein EspG n=1 Tax=Nocardia carnea TaxID=37328 RepID=UPI0024559D19|nr:ESX secretion-associated protein EspG [Nocardia carnea]
MRSWELTDLEFRALCEDHTEGRLPRPLVFTSSLRWEDEYEWELAQTRRALRARYNGELDALGAGLARPDVFVSLQAFGGDQDFDNPEVRTRVHAFRQRARGFVITQRPGETVHHAAGFDIVECDPHALADIVLSRVPFAHAGRLPDTAIPDTTRDPRFQPGYTTSGSMISDNDEDEDAGNDYDRALVFLRMPAVRSGSIRVVQGRSKYGPRGRIEMGMLWRDVPEDGRYAIPLHHPAPTATGMGTAELTEWLDEQIGSVVTRLDRNMEIEE